MLYVFPRKQRNLPTAILCWPFVFLATLWNHPNQGFDYAYYWANYSVTCRDPKKPSNVSKRDYVLVPGNAVESDR